MEKADRIVLLMRGKVARQGRPEELIAASGAEDLTGAYVALTGAKAEAAG